MKVRLTLTNLINTSLIVCLLTIGSCSKEKSNSTDQQQQDISFTSAQSEAQAEMTYNEFFDNSMGANNDVGIGGTGIFGRGESVNGYYRLDSLPPCATVTIIHSSSTSFFPVQITIDFGATGCIRQADGHTRKGKIIIEYTNRLLYPDAVASTTFDNFYIDENKIEGTVKVTNTSTQSNNQLIRQFTFDVINGKISSANGNYVEWNSHKTITQTEGISTLTYPKDDVFQIEGYSTGRTQNGNLLVAWKSNITKPLVKTFNCRWLTQGTVEIVRDATNANATWNASLDYGNGNCDNLATVTINGIIRQISLH